MSAQFSIFGSDHRPIYHHHVSGPHHSRHGDAQENHHKMGKHHHAHGNGKHESKAERQQQQRAELEKLQQDTTQEELEMKELQRQMEMGEWHDDFEEEDQLKCELVHQQSSTLYQEEDGDELEFDLRTTEIVLNNYIPVSTLSSRKDRDRSSINPHNKEQHHRHHQEAESIPDQALSKSQEVSKQAEEISNQNCDDDDDTYAPPHIMADSDGEEDADDEDEDLDSIWRNLNGSSDTIETCSSYETA